MIPRFALKSRACLESIDGQIEIMSTEFSVAGNYWLYTSGIFERRTLVLSLMRCFGLFSVFRVWSMIFSFFQGVLCRDTALRRSYWFQLG